MQTIQDQTQLHEILDVLRQKPAGPKNHKTSLSTLQRILFVITITSVVGSVTIAMLSKISWIPLTSAMIWSLGSLGIGELGCLLMSASIAWSLLREISQPLSTVRNPAIQVDYLRISQLRTFPVKELEYLSQRLQLEAEQLRSQFGLFVGAIDKVGIIPLVVGSAYTFWKWKHDAGLGSNFITVGLAGLISSYLFGMFLTVKSHRVDVCAQLLKLATSKDEPCVTSSDLSCQSNRFSARAVSPLAFDGLDSDRMLDGRLTDKTSRVPKDPTQTYPIASR
jgi:hypothetical protein